MRTRLFLFLLIFLSIISCQNENDIEIDSESLLIGNWVQPIYKGDTTTYQRANNLEENAPGVSFQKEYSFFTERTSGFCGTPPLTFFDRQGTWKLAEKNLKIHDLNITNVVGAKPFLWYNYRIIEITETQLILKRELTEQERDYRALMTLFDEIHTLSTSVSCTNSNDWLSTDYGSKACGGSQGYIAYSTQIDTVTFLEKVAFYTEAENQFNRKWGVVSTCDIPCQPRFVECKNGYPILK